MTVTAYAVLLRDRGVRVRDIAAHAEDLRADDGTEDVAWIVVPTPGRLPSGAGLVPGSALRGRAGSSPGWALLVAGRLVELHTPAGRLFSWPRDLLPEDWWDAALRRGTVHLLTAPPVEDPRSLPAQLPDILADTRARGVVVALTAPASPEPGGPLSLPQHRLGALPTAPLPDGYALTVADLSSLGCDLADLAAETAHTHRDARGTYHENGECPAAEGETKWKTAPLGEVLPAGCPACGTHLTSPLTAWKDHSPVRRHTERLVELIGLNDRVLRAGTVLTALRAQQPLPPAGLRPTPSPVPYGWAAALECVTVQRELLGMGVYDDRARRAEPWRAAVQAAAVAAAGELVAELVRIGEPTAERAVFAALAATDPELAAPVRPDVARHCARYLAAGYDPLAQVPAMAQLLAAPPEQVAAEAATYLAHLDQFRVEPPGPLTAALVVRDGGWPKAPVLQLAALRFGMHGPARVNVGLMVAAAAVTDACERIGGAKVRQLGTLWPGEEPAHLAAALESVGDHAGTWEIEKAVAAQRERFHLLAADAPVGYRPLDGAPDSGTRKLRKHEGQRR